MNLFSDPKRIIISLLCVVILCACGLSPEEQAEIATLVAQDIANTQTAQATDTPTPAPTATLTPPPSLTSMPNRTATAIIQATQRASSLAEKVQQLFQDGRLDQAEGVYYQLEDYEMSLAKINWMEPYATGYYGTDFVLSGNLGWETAKEGANITASGCGFTFGIDEDFKNYHIAILALDGNVRLFRCQNCGGQLRLISSDYYGKVDYMKDNATVMLIVEDKRIQFFVNGEHTFDLPNQKDYDGYLTYTISSGTNYKFGTRCTFSNMELWDMSPGRPAIQGN